MAYRFAYDSSAERKRWLKPYIHFYDHHRAHASLNYNPPIRGRIRAASWTQQLAGPPLIRRYSSRGFPLNRTERISS
jgi:hypothetical protein